MNKEEYKVNVDMLAALKIDIEHGRDICEEAIKLQEDIIRECNKVYFLNDIACMLLRLEILAKNIGIEDIYSDEEIQSYKYANAKLKLNLEKEKTKARELLREYKESKEKENNDEL